MGDFALASNSGIFSEREFTRHLISLYRDCPVLWKVKSRDYFNRNKRNAALEKIVEALRAFKPDFTVHELKQKINTLRTNFNRKHRAIDSSSGDISEPTLWYYNELSFVKDQYETAPPETSDTKPQLSENKQSLTASRTTLSSNRPALPVSLKRKSQTDFTEEPVGTSTKYVKLPDQKSVEDVLAKGWAMKLKKLQPDQRLFAEKIINDTLFEAEMGTLTRNGAHFITEPS